MATIVTRSGKGSPLTNVEVDANFTNLNTDKLETSAAYTNANAVAAVVASDLDMGGNKVLFGNFYSAVSDLPNASTYHGMFAHVHATGLAYYAHSGAWVPLARSSDVYTHPNHTGEVTSTADGATVVADNVIDEANLKISNTPTNGYVLTAQSGDTGGLTWAADSTTDSTKLPLAGGTMTGALKTLTLQETKVDASYSSNATTLNLATANVFNSAPSGNVTYTFSNPPSSGTAFGFALKVTPSATASLTWPSTVDWASATAPDAPASGATNVYTFYTVDGGTIYYGFLAGAAMA